ncbi:putative acyl-CoA dehydrogenase [Gordonia hirsuta DSM 44140 = NBRC 16056]|uniref:Putative acyl-CoA dehydrogenase n=1 Tax=Gordonia hirsuta DSM 44140 = NBRC 16056 TaxID=1121927 RepID=L7LD60_9ACTN|nr:acyl-CoA dehydrogenase family protein [Gordonia hirsuta]GAC57987.1 putative acyl-CoA dehydrogenase [Gordonia hirsuta DSM 44140 = NBRC 16056]
MEFLLDQTHDDLADTVTALTERAGGTAVARAWSDGDRGPALAVYRQLAQGGITGLLVPEELGGSGAGPVEMMVAVEALGRSALPGPVVETCAVVPHLLAVAGNGDELAPLLAGDTLGTVAAPPRQPRAADTEGAAVYLLDGRTLSRGVPSDVQSTVDPARTVAAVTAGPALVDGIDVAAVTDLAALATAAYTLGLGSTMLSVAADYARARNQFGKPIGSFQAVKHHLADVAIALEMARPLVWGAALTLDRSDCSAAKVATADAADLAARRALQVLGAIGYTAEHDLALYLTRARALRSAWGTPAVHRAAILETL